ncbi:hypothetical protein BOX15_Mlig010748g1, partial [Macrostomum lignano]
PMAPQNLPVRKLSVAPEAYTGTCLAISGLGGIAFGLFLLANGCVAYSDAAWLCIFTGAVESVPGLTSLLFCRCGCGSYAELSYYARLTVACTILTAASVFLSVSGWILFGLGMELNSPLAPGYSEESDFCEDNTFGYFISFLLFTLIFGAAHLAFLLTIIFSIFRDSAASDSTESPFAVAAYPEPGRNFQSLPPSLVPPPATNPDFKVFLPTDKSLGLTASAATGVATALVGLAGAAVALAILNAGCPWSLDSLSASLILGCFLAPSGGLTAPMLSSRGRPRRRIRLMTASIASVCVCVCLSAGQLLAVALDLMSYAQERAPRLPFQDRGSFSYVPRYPACESKRVFVSVFGPGALGFCLLHLTVSSVGFHYFRKSSAAATADKAAADEDGAAQVVPLMPQEQQLQ